MPKLPKEPVLLTVVEAAEVLKCTTRNVRILLQSERLKGMRIPDMSVAVGYHYMVPLSEIERYAALHFKRGCKRGTKRTKRQ